MFFTEDYIRLLKSSFCAGIALVLVKFGMILYVGTLPVAENSPFGWCYF